ncbi:HEAT repeat domain-containing protein [Herminiimonas fonticola]|uniref:HEAT repeat protein n=1 Tax=Herminiimonas fonticola TaxID=303380 RepID=A0A4R6G4U6_9BURK|nr:HEAT repeat domain-containing protein [Herminiimonas fonticola]RBA23059.1 HEAT repeat [Herminiimonas fonticola]TDN89499.1 HEAT repeat protein [Herminiimonas fonticola]
MTSASQDSHYACIAWIGICAVGLTLLLVLMMVYLRMSLNRRAQEERAFLSVWRPLLLSSLQSSISAVLPTLAANERVYFLKLWNNLMRTATGDAAANLISIAYSVGCDYFSRRLLRYGDRVECLLATLALGHMRDHPSWDLLVTKTLAADNVTSINAFQSLVQIDAEATAQQLMPLLLAREDWPIAHVAAILQSAQGAFLQPLLEATVEIKSVHLVRTLRLIEALHLAIPQSIVLRLLDVANDTDTIIAALRIANDAGLLTQVRTYLNHADWRVRVQAAKVIGRIGEHADINRLIPLLADTEWWVRYRAARALIAMPFFSIAEIEQLRDNLSDRFARDMLGQVLAERKTA